MENVFELLQKLEEFFCSPTFSSALGSFFSDHVHELDFKPLDEEQPLKNHDVYRQYTEMVEQLLNKFMAEEHLTQEEIFEACQKAQAAEGGSAWLTCIDYLVASTEYESFMELAFDHKSMMEFGDGADGGQWLPIDEPLEI